ncbi:helicase HerA-like domain-containing protein [Peptoniphilus raoultii]|uniref:helicase HerA-like domain-containing protein n=1 Tax=Peptoniphilus raoultii TaxID=1776387 RepID=UPI0008D9DD1A|nr:helicase HerA-like domain-containing protein [Peptoniphilus raoultii]
MSIFLGKGKEKYYLRGDKLNQHGIIAGATGSGKTVTLKVLCEELSDMGVPTFVSDVKGDLSNISKVGENNENVEKRVKNLDLENFDFKSYPTNIWDVYGEKGIKLRVSLSELGPLLLSQVLDLNETQEGIINIIFKYCDENGLLLIDLKDLNQLIDYINEKREELSKKYGNITSSSLSAIKRKLLLLEEEGGNEFFGEPSCNVMDFIATNSEGRGYVNILNSKKLINSPRLYSIFLIYLFSELFEKLPEIGNPEKPRIVFFFDEAHLLFKNISKALMEKITQVVRLIRSKGVGIFFISQSPLDLPDEISSQLATKIIHQLRAFSPKEVKNLKDVAGSLRKNQDLNTEEELQNLGTGFALVQSLDENGIPLPLEKVIIRPPHSSFKLLTDDEMTVIFKNSNLYGKYFEGLDRISAFEVLSEKIRQENAALEKAKKAEEEKKLREKEEKEREKAERALEKKRSKDLRYVNKGIDSMLGTITRTIGREIARGILGSLRKR